MRCRNELVLHVHPIFCFFGHFYSPLRCWIVENHHLLTATQSIRIAPRFCGLPCVLPPCQAPRHMCHIATTFPTVCFFFFAPARPLLLVSLLPSPATLTLLLQQKTYTLFFSFGLRIEISSRVWIPIRSWNKRWKDVWECPTPSSSCKCNGNACNRSSGG